MSNLSAQITGQATPSGRIPFVFRNPAEVDQSKPQPLIIFLHGIGEQSQIHTAAAALTTLQTGVWMGPIWYSKTGSSTGGILPQFAHPITGEMFDFYCIAPQLYGNYPPTSGNPTPASSLWSNLYVPAAYNYAVSNWNVDVTRVYLLGFSLGFGGVVRAMQDPNINKLFAACGGSSTGYAQGSSENHAEIAECGVRMIMAHSAADTVASASTFGDQIYSRIMAADPLFPVTYYRWATGDHNDGALRFFSPLFNRNYAMSNGFPNLTMMPIYQNLLISQRNDQTRPLYI